MVFLRSIRPVSMQADVGSDVCVVDDKLSSPDNQIPPAIESTTSMAPKLLLAGPCIPDRVSL
jgi:hypothetical protein